VLNWGSEHEVRARASCKNIRMCQYNWDPNSTGMHFIYNTVFDVLYFYQSLQYKNVLQCVVVL